MRKPLTLIFTLLIFFGKHSSLLGQNLSNKGKEFWVAYGYHQSMIDNNDQNMVLYFATERTTNIKVSIPGLNYSRTYSNISANTVFSTDIIPKAGSQDARLINELGVSEAKGIHIESDQPIVAYAHIYNENISGATILYPVNTLGKEYYSMNYTNLSNSDNSSSYTYVIACDTGITTVEITPAENTELQQKGSTFRVNLKQGEVYLLKGEKKSIIPPDTYNSSDLTGTIIKSVSSNEETNCKRIAVFSGSGRVSITCDNRQSSSDNYMVQALPVGVWGKKYLTAPLSLNSQRNFYRIGVRNPNTKVKINDLVLTQPLESNFYYQIGPTNTPLLIEADEPIMVAQYIPSQNACGNSGLGDPEVVYLNPVEQTITNANWYSTTNFAIKQHGINIIIKNEGTALSSLKLDGNPIASNQIKVHPSAGNYSLIQIPVNSGNHNLESDSGFNAIAYGFGEVESYSYTTGTNLNDLSKYIETRNKYSLTSTGKSCRANDILVSLFYPSIPQKIVWKTNGNIYTNNNPTPSKTTLSVTGKIIYQFDLEQIIQYQDNGEFLITAEIFGLNADGCNNKDEIFYTVTVEDKPTNIAEANTLNCANTPIQLKSKNKDNTTNIPTWILPDERTFPALDTSIVYPYADELIVKSFTTNQIGCYSDTNTFLIKKIETEYIKTSLPERVCLNDTFSIKANLSFAPNDSIEKVRLVIGNKLMPLENNASIHIRTALEEVSDSRVYFEVEKKSGCNHISDTNNLKVLQLPVFKITNTTTCLPNETTVFTATYEENHESYENFTIHWRINNENFEGNERSKSFQFTRYDSNFVYVRGENSFGCSYDTTFYVTNIFAPPVALLNFEDQICESKQISLSALIQNESNVESTWTLNDSIIGKGNTVQLSNIQPGIYKTKVILKQTSEGLCESSYEKNLVIKPSPIQSIEYQDIFCTEKNFDVKLNQGKYISQLEVNINDIDDLFWKYNDSEKSITMSFRNQGIQKIPISLKNEFNCKIDTFLSFRVIKTPDVKISNNISCISDEYSKFFSESDSQNQDENTFTYEWSFFANNKNTLLYSSIEKNPKIKFPNEGIYTVVHKKIAAGTCASVPVEKIVTVNGMNINSEMSISKQLFCSGDSMVIYNTSSIDYGKIDSVRFEWSLNGTEKYQIPYNSFTKKAVLNIPNLSQESNLTIYQYNISGETCQEEHIQNVRIVPIPTLGSISKLDICEFQNNIKLDTAVVTNSRLGKFDFFINNQPLTDVNQIKYLPKGNYSLKQVFTSDEGCATNTVSEISIKQRPIVAIKANGSPFIEDTPFEIEGNAFESKILRWLPENIFRNQNIQNKLNIALSKNSWIYVESIHENGCRSIDSLWITVIPKPVIPNVFTPNNDGIGDKWEIPNLKDFPKASVTVFTKNGQKVFESYQYQVSWDGTFNGKNCPIGTYYYIIKLGPDRPTIKGFVDIIR